MSNNNEILEGMPQHLLYNSAGLLPVAATYELTIDDVQNLVLEFVRSYLNDCLSVTWAPGDRDREGSRERSRMHLYMIFSEDSPNVTKLFPDDIMAVGYDNEWSDELKNFLQKFSDKTHAKNGNIGECVIRKDDVMLRHKQRGLVGFELNLQAIIQVIFDAFGTGYAKAAGIKATQDLKTEIRVFDWVQPNNNNKIVGAIIQKVIIGPEEVIPNGVVIPKGTRAF